MNRNGRNRSILHQRNGEFRICLTVVMLGILIGVVLFAYAAFGSPSVRPMDGTKLQQMIVVFRHGDRTPTETYPNDPYSTHEWPGGWGALTKRGMLQMYKVGQWLRNEYGDTIGKRYQSSLSYVESSYADRCIMSAQALLSGLYPPEQDEIFFPGLPWRPIPVHMTPRNLDKVIVVKAPCPRLEQALKEAYANESRISDDRMSAYYKELSSHTGQKIATITDVEFLYNTLEIEQLYGLKLPEWTAKFYNEKMREIAARSLAIFTSDNLQKRLRGGPLLKKILQHMTDSTLVKDKRTAYLYSAHDITLVNLLRTIGFTNELFKPDYGAALIFELHTRYETSSLRQAQVKLVYLNNTESRVAHDMPIPGCDTPCLLENFTDLWKDVIPEDWDRECLTP